MKGVGAGKGSDRQYSLFDTYYGSTSIDLGDATRLIIVNEPVPATHSL